jgi:hypothetical protein
MKKGKAIPVTGHEGPQACETSRLPYFLDNRLRDGGEVVSPTRRPLFTPRKIPGTHRIYFKFERVSMPKFANLRKKKHNFFDFASLNS